MNSINIEISNTEYRELIHKSATLDMILDAWDKHEAPNDWDITHVDHNDFLMDLCKIILQYYKEIKEK